MNEARRVSCVLCALKHLGQARALFLEARQGYPNHWWFGMGHFAEASDELASDYEALAAMVREERKKAERDPAYMPDFEKLVETVSQTTGYDVSPVLGAER